MSNILLRLKIKFNKSAKIVKNKFILVYFGILFLLLSLVYFPSFFYPPRSDYWSTAYFFHRIDSLAGPFAKWMHILQYDPWSQVRFQPLAYVILYFEWLFFGSNFICFHIFNFSLYCISILLLYKLAISFCRDKLLVAAFLGVFAFLFSHFDIVSWSYHAYIIFAFCSLLLGFIMYINFLKSGKKLLLLFVSILFLIGIFCYETFIFWPLAIIILSYIEDLVDKEKIKKNELRKNYILVIGTVYICYIIFFIFIKVFRIYEESATSLSSLLSMRTIILSIFATFFNIIYNGFLINFIPLLACPLEINENLNLGGILNVYSPYLLNKIISITGVVFLAIFFWLMVYLFRRREFKAMKIIIFLFFLMCSEFFLLFYFRTLTNTTVFNLTQFRYLYITNAFIILLVLYLIDTFFNLSKKGKNIMYSCLIIILIFNIYATRKYGISILNQQLAPLKKILLNIKTGIKTGQISKENKLYLDNNIAKKLPSLCWNKEMGERFMRGTYQWVFSEEEIKCFSSLKEAKWIIDEKDFSIVNK